MHFEALESHPSSLFYELASKKSIEPLVSDFCEFWIAIHEYISNLRIHKISKTVEIAETFKEEYTIPLYKKYKSSPLIDYSPAWMKTLAAFSFRWKEGRILFPLRLITYELAYYNDDFLQTYLVGLITGEIPGTVETLFASLFPKLSTIALPLSRSDLVLLRGFQEVYRQSKTAFHRPPAREYVAHIPDLAPETLRNKMEQFNYFQMAIPMKFLDMGRLGYETYLISHCKPLPPRFQSYCLSSVMFGTTWLSLIQLPVSLSQWIVVLKDFLAKSPSSPQLCIPMKHRLYNWNLTNLKPGLNQWQLPLTFFHSDPSKSFPASPPTMEMGLDPSFDPYRPLTPADLKLLSFLTTVGEIRQINDLSIHLDLHRNTIVRLLKDYQKNKLLYRVVHFFNLGLDLSIHVYLQLPHCERNVPFLTQAQSLPWIDIFKTETKDTTIYFGKMRIPQMWTAAFISRMHVLRTTFPDLRLQYSFDPPQHAKWNLSLLETYDME